MSKSSVVSKKGAKLDNLSSKKQESNDDLEIKSHIGCFNAKGEDFSMFVTIEMIRSSFPRSDSDWSMKKNIWPGFRVKDLNGLGKNQRGSHLKSGLKS